MKETILAISGKSGLYKLLSQNKSVIIVESVSEQKKRTTIGMHDRITALNDVSMYTTGDDVSLMDVFESIKKVKEGGIVDIDTKKATKDQLVTFMREVLPDFDEERVYPNDMKKLILWYNTLITNGYTEFKDKEEKEVE
ncbi:MAG: DUF5606 domain-containing protein [Prevotellaceae bacterium]|nr:DUF5606 domain-containing protein [Candidatus Faecinaster equi]